MRKGLVSILLLGLVFSLPYPSSGQEISVKGGFVEDSLEIGNDIHFWVTAQYDPKLELFLLDTPRIFAPFEPIDKEYFETLLREDKAFDSAIFTIQSFEIDPVQYLKVPAFILNKKDTLAIYSNLDSIYLKEYVPVVTDTTKLKTNLSYSNVDTPFNFPLIRIVVGIILFILILLLLIFGNRINKYFKLRRLRKQYQAFSEQLAYYIHRLKEEPTPEIAEKSLQHWKNYQEKLDRKPFSSLSTKEILKLNFAKELEHPLKSIDRLVYGKKATEKVYQDFQQIEDFTEHRYLKKVETIKNGK